MSQEVVVAIIGSLGLGGAVSGLLSRYLDRDKQIKEARKVQMRVRYLAIMILMFTRLDPKLNLRKLKKYRSDINTVEDLNNELELEVYNSLIFASDDVT